MEITDELLITAIKSGNTRKRDWALYQFYADEAIRNWANNYIKNQGGRTVEAEDVFQEAMCIFDRNIRQDRFDGKSSLKTYLLGIIKWHWVTYRRKQGKVTELKPEQLNGTTESIEMAYIQSEKKMILEKAIVQIDERCQELLKYYKLDYSMKEIKELMGFSSPEMAKKQSYRCRNKLRKVFLDHPAWLAALNIKIENV